MSPNFLKVDGMEKIRVKYEISAKDIKKAARLVAREQSLGVRVTQYENSDVKAMEASVAKIKKGWGRGRITIEIPSGHIKTAYGLILSIAGEISCLNSLRTIQLVDFKIPPRLAQVLGGPQWGSEGLREQLGVKNRPIFVTVVKPSQGLSPKEFGDLAYECFVGGMDVCKPDEILQDDRDEYIARVRACVEAARQAEAETGEKKRFMIHPIGPADRMGTIYSDGVSAGGGMAMFAPAAVGFPQFHSLAQTGRLPIMAHMSMSGWLWQKHGISVKAWAKLVRLLGADAILYPALKGSLKSSRAEIEVIQEVCGAPIDNLKTSLPAVGGGQHAATLAPHVRVFGPDFIFLCGGGVVGHPKGARAGAKSICQAWDAIREGASLKNYAKKAPELAGALKAFEKYV